MEYFTEKDLEEAVCQALMSRHFKILDFRYEKVALAADAYMGNHFRIIVNVLYANSENAQNFFAKFLPADEAHKTYVKDSNFFGKEAHFYSCIVPLMNTLLPSELQLPIPICYFARGGSDEPESPHYCPNPEESAIILDDLYQLGYRMPDKRVPLDLHHCRLVLRALAILHGASILLQLPKKEDDDTYKSLSLDFSSIKESVFIADETHVSNHICRAAAETTASVICKLWPDRFNNDLICSKLLDTIWDGWKSVFNIVCPSSKYANVICHGDVWCSNLMFAYRKERYGPQTPLDVKLIDMQLYRFAPPVTDILFFLHISTRRALREQHLSELLSYYHNELVRTVSPGIAQKILSLSSIQESMKEFKIFGLIIAMYLLPILLNRQRDEPSESTFKNVDESACAPRISGVMNFLLSDRTEQILKNIKESSEFKERMLEAYQEYLELVGLWKK